MKTDLTKEPWPSSICFSSPVAESQILTVLSSDPDTIYRPSTENETELTKEPCPSSVRFSSPVAESQARRKRAHGKGRLGLAEVFDGEAEGARHGLRHALRLFPGRPLHLCLDNTAVIQGLTGEAPMSSQDAFLEFHETNTIADIQVHWVPGHQNIEGNEEADRLAKEGSALESDPNLTATYAGVKGLIRTKRAQLFTQWWEQESHKHTRDKYTKFGLGARLRCPGELDLPRPILHRLLACRSGHGDFEWYHSKFNHDDATPCSCGTFKSPDHLVFCRKSRIRRALWPNFDPEPQSLNDYWTRLVSSPKDFTAFLKVTRFYEEICPRDGNPNRIPGSRSPP